ncbi:hypothetical protein [Solitalea lacus]|uniref:hypothetical protein n=1 Tax=Solitalea lacus TaxID=2911172 RepID=UPI001EDBB3DD|nr:hypothetical protein [Solitalea lacus]UKJ08246.1 hypothetical protein L2B55_03520 [Solitalea lacus]
MINLIGILITLCLLSTLFVLTGRVILVIANIKNKTTIPLIVSCTYFLGMAVFLAIWRTFSLITDNALLSLGVTLMIAVAMIFFNWKQTCQSFFFDFFELIKSKWYLLFSISIFFFVGLYWIGSFNELNPFTIIGSLHSPRYANFATYVVEFNRVPVLGQNYGQSMLASIPMFLGFNSPLLALNFWLSITMINFSLLIYSLCLYLNCSAKFSTLATFLVLFGNTAISFFHILSIDSGSPFILNGYTDSIASIGTFIVVLFFLKDTLANDSSFRDSIKEIVLIFSVSVFWNIAAPQDSMFFGFLIGLVLIFSFKNNIKATFKIFMLFLVFSCVGIFQGGMYTPSKFKESIVLPGMMEIGSGGIAINPGVPFFVGIGGAWEYGNKNVITQVSDVKKQITSSPKLSLVVSKILIIEQLVTNSLKVVFWPMLGIIGLILIIKTNTIKNGNLFSKQLALDYNKLIFVAFFVFFIGLIFNLFFSISGYKWELSRFLILGYFLGMICLVLCLNFLFESRILSKWSLYFLMVLITIGPIVNSFAVIFVNIFYTNNRISFLEKINILINTSGMIK